MAVEKGEKCIIECIDPSYISSERLRNGGYYEAEWVESDQMYKVQCDNGDEGFYRASRFKRVTDVVLKDLYLRCLNATDTWRGRLTAGKVYKAIGVMKDGCYLVRCDSGEIAAYMEMRFEELSKIEGCYELAKQTDGKGLKIGFTSFNMEEHEMKVITIAGEGGLSASALTLSKALSTGVEAHNDAMDALIKSLYPYQKTMLKKYYCTNPATEGLENIPFINKSAFEDFLKPSPFKLMCYDETIHTVWEVRQQLELTKEQRKILMEMEEELNFKLEESAKAQRGKFINAIEELLNRKVHMGRRR